MVNRQETGLPFEKGGKGKSEVQDLRSSLDASRPNNSIKIDRVKEGGGQ